LSSSRKLKTARLTKPRITYSFPRGTRRREKLRGEACDRRGVASPCEIENVIEAMLVGTFLAG
jgi:hypothetical protein